MNYLKSPIFFPIQFERIAYINTTSFKEHDDKKKECDGKVRFYKEEIAKYVRTLMSND